VHAQTNYEKNKQKLFQQSLPDFKPRLLTTAYNRNKTSTIRSKTPEASQGWFEANKSRITQEENMKQPQNGNPLPYSSMSRSKTPDYQSNKLEISKENKKDAEEAIEPKKSSSIDLEKLEKLFSYCSNLNKKEEIEIQVIEETTLEDNVTQQVTRIELDIEDTSSGEDNTDKAQEEVKEDKNECLIQNETSIEKEEEVQKEKCEEIENPVAAPYREEEEVYSFRSESTQSIIKSLLDTSTKKQNEKSVYFEGEVDDTEIDSFKQNLLDLSKNLQMLKDSFKNFQSTQRPSKTELFSQENVEPEKQNISKSKRKKSRKNSKQDIIEKEALFSNSILNNSIKERRGSIQSSHISVKRDSKPKSPNQSRQSVKNESNVLAIRKSNTMEASKISRGSAKYEKYDYESENNVCRSLFRDECSSISLESTHQGALSFSIQDSASNTYKEQTFRPHGPGEILNKNIQSDSLSFKKYTHENEPIYRDPIGIISINKPDGKDFSIFFSEVF